MGGDSLVKSTHNTIKFIWSICLIGPQVWNIVEKKALSGVHSPCAMRKIVHFQNVCWYDLPNFYPCHEVGGDDKIKALV